MKLRPSVAILPMPMHSVLLAGIWLLLTHSYSPGNILLALFLAVIIPVLVAPLHRVQRGMQRPWKTLPFLGRVLIDILLANLEVALLVIGPLKRLQPALVAVPLDITGDLPITLLASTVSLTPGTVSAELSDDRKWLYVHVLNQTERSDDINRIKTRYEKPLMEIFGC